MGIPGECVGRVPEAHKHKRVFSAELSGAYDIVSKRKRAVYDCAPGLVQVMRLGGSGAELGPSEAEHAVPLMFSKIGGVGNGRVRGS